jgi:hypothetical protein
MKSLKIIGVVILGLWMLWVSWQLAGIKEIALEACGIASVGGMDQNGGIKVPVVCPALNDNEIKQQKK